jgi:hypothetical protein
MARDQGRDKTRRIEGALDKFEPGGVLGPLEDRDEREQRVNTLPSDQKELASFLRSRRGTCRQILSLNSGPSQSTTFQNAFEP